LPQAVQLAESEDGSMHCPLQQVPEIGGPAPGMAQGSPSWLAAQVVPTQIPPAQVLPVGQGFWPSQPWKPPPATWQYPLQIAVVGQPTPHDPQFRGSDDTSTGPPPQQ
jgi:hypothetical protein